MMNGSDMFEQPLYFWWLIAIPVIAGIYSYGQRFMDKRVRKVGDPRTVSKLLERNGNLKWEWICLSVGWCFFCIALANPRAGVKKEKVKVETADIILALDISNSMNATDVSPSRIDKARRFLSGLIQQRRGDQIGLIVFAGEAFLQLPLTRDYAAADLMVRAAATSMAGSQGTALAEAMRMAAERVKNEQPRAMVLVTDGEDHDGEAVDAAREAAGKGWHIFPVAVGTVQGGYVPDSDEPGAPARMQADGSPVMSALNIPLLKEIAAEGRGSYYLLEEDEKLIETLSRAIDALGKQEREVRSFTEYESYYAYFLSMGLIFMLLPWIVLIPVKALRYRQLLLVVVCLVSCFCVVAQGQSAHDCLREGDKNYDKREFQDAEKQYRKAGIAGRESGYNLGNTLMKQQRYEEAAAAYGKAIEKAKNASEKADALHNQGNAYYQQQQYDKSISSYKEALKINPGAEDTRKNLALAQWQRKKQQQEDKQQDQSSQEGNSPQQDSSGQQQQGQPKPQDQPAQQPAKEEGSARKKDSSGQEGRKPGVETEKLFNLMDQEERRVQQKMHKGKGKKAPAEKDW